MKLSDFDFDLPPDLIATRPARPRTASRLLVATPTTILDSKVADIDQFLRRGDRLILNDTKVIPARLTGRRTRVVDGQTAVARIEVTLLSPDGDAQWQALLKPLRKVKIGEDIVFGDDFRATLTGIEDGTARLAFNVTGHAFEDALNAHGAMPLPPYIAAKRPADNLDRTDYQTVWAQKTGAVAAPTASLHFDAALLTRLAAKGVKFTHVTLHVGAGTFLPVKTDDVSQHRMHAEWGEITANAADDINATRLTGGRIIPVGTTALRLIETGADETGRLHAFRGETDIFIRPGYEFRIADGLMTNFHLPKSTLMMLVSAFMGTQRVREIYFHAILQGYRFFSYGDSSLLLPGGVD